MHIDHKNISKAYARLFESSSHHTLKHVIELKVDWYDGIDMDLVLDGIRVTSSIIDSPNEATSKITEDVNNYLKEKIGDISDYVLPRLLDNLESKLKELVKRKSKREYITITRVVVSGTFSVTESLVSNY